MEMEYNSQETTPKNKETQNDSFTSQQVVKDTQPRRKSSANKILLVVGLLFGFTLFAIGGYYIGINKSEQGNRVLTASPLPTRSPTSNTQPSTKSADIAPTKYINAPVKVDKDKLISYAIPKGWSKTINQELSIIHLRSHDYSRGGGIGIDSGAVISILAELRDSEKTLKEELEYDRFGNEVDLNPIKIDGINGLMFYGGYEVYGQYFYVVNGDYQWSITINASVNLKENLQYKQLINNFIDSIQFNY